MSGVRHGVAAQNRRVIGLGVYSTPEDWME
jgi:hypothetical protein